jgi:hypothetical protein
VTATEPRQKSETRRRTRLVGVRLLPAEHAVMDRAATQRGVTVPDLLRTSALSALACGDEHPLAPGVLCKVVGPHVLHTYDGGPDWAADTDTKDNQ